MLLKQSQLAELRRTLRDERALSVYLGHAAADPAQRGARQTELRRAVEAIRSSLTDQSHSEREAFERSVAQIADALERELPGTHGLAWVGFATPERVHFADSVPAPMPTLVRWQRGIWAAPYVRALKQHRAVIVAIIDGVSASVYRYLAGTLIRIEKLEEHPRGGHADRLGAPPRQGFHPGTRGASAADLEAKGRVAARERVADEAAHRIAELAGDTGYVIVGGNAAAAHVLMHALPASVAPRAQFVPELGTRASDPDIRAAAERGARALRDSEDQARVARILEAVGAHGAAVSGSVAAMDAIGEGRAHEALLTEHFVNVNPVEAERAIELALDHGTELEIVTGVAAERLETAAGGIAVQLRFVPKPAEPLVAAPL